MPSSFLLVGRVDQLLALSFRALADIMPLLVAFEAKSIIRPVSWALISTKSSNNGWKSIQLVFEEDYRHVAPRLLRQRLRPNLSPR
jgi:hypothetical protein